MIKRIAASFLTNSSFYFSKGTTRKLHGLSIYNFNTNQAAGAPAPPPPRKIPNFWQIPERQSTELGLALHGAHTCRMLATLLKENLNIVEDRLLAFAITRIYHDQLELDQYFTNEIVPITKELVKAFTREHNSSLGDIIAAFGWLQVNDDSAWALFETKLVKERLYRVIPLPILVKVAHGLATANRGSKELWAIIENEIVQHQKAFLYDPEMLDYARKAFEIRGDASSVTQTVLSNPNTDLQAFMTQAQTQQVIGQFQTEVPQTH